MLWHENGLDVQARGGLMSSCAPRGFTRGHAILLGLKPPGVCLALSASTTAMGCLSRFVGFILDLIVTVFFREIEVWNEAQVPKEVRVLRTVPVAASRALS
jgi:hypothetical protein